jgi:predicted transcriptional regulator
MQSIIISIKPEFCKVIYSGEKDVELRRRIGVGFVVGAKLYIYTSKVDKSITGEAYIGKVELLPLKDLKAKYLLAACISEVDFDKYFYGCREGYAVSIHDVGKYKNSVTLKDLGGVGFRAPQSFMYAGKDLINYIESRVCT